MTDVIAHKHPRQGTAGFLDDAAAQQRILAQRVPVYGRLLEYTVELVMAHESIAGRFAAAWGSRTFPAPYDRPLLYLAALRLDALQRGTSHPLWPAIGSLEPHLDAVTPSALRASLNETSPVWRTLATSFVQTNEPSRAVAWLWPAACIRGPLALIDLGASAGLNLIADRLPNIWTTGQGTPCQVAANPQVLLRLGLDARPLDVSHGDSADWLRACTWPGETRRLDRLNQAIAAWNAEPGLGRVEVADAQDMPDRLLEQARRLGDTCTVLAYQTVFRDYLGATERATYEHGMQHALHSLPPGRMVWVEMENAGDGDTALPVALTAHVRGRLGTLQSFVLARCWYHPWELQVQVSAWRIFSDLLQSV